MNPEDKNVMYDTDSMMDALKEFIPGSQLEDVIAGKTPDPKKRKFPMTRQDFEMIAAVIRSLPAEFIPDSVRRLVAAYFASELEQHNDRFDRKRFMEAALGTEEEDDDTEEDDGGSDDDTES